jgi:hypothetical protein
MTRLLVAAFALLAAPAWAQRIEVAPLVGYVTSVPLDRTAEGVDELTIADGIAWGARGTYFLTERLGLEAFWLYQESSVDITAGGFTAEVFEMTVNQVHGNFVYELGATDSRLQPFVFGGLGATFLSSDDLDSETKFSWDLGAGMKWFFQERFGVEGRVRYRPTELESTSDNCGPFDFCQSSMKNVDITAGFIVRF